MNMASREEQLLRTTKEIMVKFIEVGRVYPTNFNETFRNVYETVAKTVGSLKETAEDKPPGSP